ncbi:Pleckstrin y domain-containing protein 1 [Glycine soja]
MPSHLRAPMASLWCVTIGMTDNATDYDSVEFWSNPERTGGWLTKQGEYIKTWHHRWFVLKQGKLFWFKDSAVTRASRTRGVVPVVTYLTIKGAKDILNKPNAFELSTRSNKMYFIADFKKEKEDWINSMAGAEGFVEIFLFSIKEAPFHPFLLVPRKKTPQCDEESSRKCTSDPARDFIGALKAANERTGLPGLIAEVKKVSPSRESFWDTFCADRVLAIEGIELIGINNRNLVSECVTHATKLNGQGEEWVCDPRRGAIKGGVKDGDVDDGGGSGFGGGGGCGGGR